MSRFTRQHYEAMAAMIYKQPDTPERADFVVEMADMLAADNPHFDRARFEHACSVPAIASIPTALWNAMAMQGPDCDVAKQVLNVSLLSHANGVFNHTVGLLCRMGLLAEGQDCTYEEFEAAFSKLVEATAYYKQEAGTDRACANCGAVGASSSCAGGQE